MMIRRRTLCCLALLAVAVTGACARAGVTVTPADDLPRAIVTTQSGDRITFAPGIYRVAKIPLKTGIIYDGGGAATLVGPADDISLELNGGTGTEITGFTFSGGMIHLGENASVNVHDNTFKNGASIKADGIGNSHLDHNTFDHSGGIMAYLDGGDCTIEYNSFDYVYEPIHTLNGKNISISFNVAQHVTRHFIEVQGSCSRSKFNYNYVSNWLSHIENGNDSHMALSLPTGEGGDNQAIGNVLINDGQTSDKSVWAKAWLEIAGTNWTLKNNYAKNWGPCVQNAKGTIIAEDNIYVGVGDAPASTTDHRFKLTDAAAPAKPIMPSNAGVRTRTRSIKPSVTTTRPARTDATPAAPTTPAIALKLAGSAAAHELTVTWLPQAAPTLLEIRPTHADITMGWEQAAQPAAGQTSLSIRTYHSDILIPGWEYDIRLTLGEQSQTITLQCPATDATTPSTQRSAVDEDIARLAQDLAILQQHRAEEK